MFNKDDSELLLLAYLAVAIENYFLEWFEAIIKLQFYAHVSFLGSITLWASACVFPTRGIFDLG